MGGHQGPQWAVSNLWLSYGSGLDIQDVCTVEDLEVAKSTLDMRM